MDDHTTPNPPAAADGSESMSVAALLRCAADGELTAEQEAQLCAHLEQSPGCSKRIEFEQQLRGAWCNADSSDAACPADLRCSIERLCQASAVGSSATDGMIDDMSGAEPPQVVTRQRSFWAGPVARGLAIAAVVVLAVTLAFQVGQRSAPVSQSPQLQLASQATAFVTKEHTKCSKIDNPDNEFKFTATTPEQLPEAFNQVLGRSVSVEDLISEADSVSFVDAGRCGVPGGGRSLHIRLSTIASGEAHTASLFVQEDSGSLEISEGPSYHLAGGKDAPGQPCVFVWRNDGMVYWLVCDQTDAKALRAAVNAPELATDPI